MFACLYARGVPASRLVPIAESFTPRFEMVEPLVMLDVSGLSRLLGSAEEIGAHLMRAMVHANLTTDKTSNPVVPAGIAPNPAGMAGITPNPAGTAGKTPNPAGTAGKEHCAIAATQTAAALLALGDPGLTIVAPGAEAQRLASLPITVLADLEHIARQRPERSRMPRRPADEPAPLPRKAAQGVGAGWGGQHPRSTHQASQARRLARRATARDRASTDALREAIKETEACVDVLRRWGIHTLEALAALPPAEVSSRLGPRGVRWQRMASGEDERPLVPWIADVPFEATLDLEWPIEGLEPLSFVLARLFDPLVARLERADRGAAVIQTTLRLVTRDAYVRTLQLPAPMRDAKTLRALVLLDLEAHPPSAAVDRVQIVLEPTPARVLQWELFERAQPSPEHVSTLLARVKALAGEGHVGSPRLLDSWKPGAFEMTEFRVADARTSEAPSSAADPAGPSTTEMHTALRRFRLPVPARVTVREGRPVRVQSDRHGVPGGVVVSAAGPWRTSGQWWDLAAGPEPPASGHHGVRGPWDRDEWDVELPGGLVYRIFVEREVGQWFIEGCVD